MLKRCKRGALLSASVLLIAIGNYFFTYPNSFCFGGTSGLSTIIAQITPLSAGVFNSVINLILVIVAFLFVGRQFAITTVFSSVAISVLLLLFDQACPLSAPLTNQPVLEFLLAVALPASGSAVLFHMSASSGGTDILAMILKKYVHLRNIGTCLFWIDLIMVLVACFVFDLTTILFCIAGLVMKTFLIDDIIANITMCKSVMIVCEDAEPICNYIMHTLGRGATISQAQGAYSGVKRMIVFTTLTRRQADRLRGYIRQNALIAFVTMFSTIDVFGNGFNKV